MVPFDAGGDDFIGQTNESFQAAALRSLETLLNVLELQKVDNYTFLGANERPRYPRLFGGQLAAQAMQAAVLTVDGHGPSPHSIQASYLRSGRFEEPVRYAVERTRDGRTTATRRVTATQSGKLVLVATVSFHDNSEDPEHPGPGPLVPESEMPGPDELPTLADWVYAAPPPIRELAQNQWVKMAPPLDIRVGEPFSFLGGSRASGPRSHWFKLPRDVDDDPTLHTILLTYASDYFLLDIAVRGHPLEMVAGASMRSTMHHSVFVHRRVHLDRWLLYTHDVVALVGTRGLVMGAIHDAEGSLVATALQEVLIPLHD